MHKWAGKPESPGSQRTSNYPKEQHERESIR